MKPFLLPALALASVALSACDNVQTRTAPVNLTDSARQAVVDVGGAVIGQSQHYKLVAATKATGGNPTSSDYKLHDGVLAPPAGQ